MVYEEALRGQLSNPDIGKYNADTLSTQNNLATLYYTLNRFDDARLLYETALEGQKQMLGGDHPVSMYNTYDTIYCDHPGSMQ